MLFILIDLLNNCNFIHFQNDGDLLGGPKVLNDAEQKSIDHKTLLGGRQAHSKRSGVSIIFKLMFTNKV